MNDFYQMAGFFVWKPERAWAVAIGFFALYILSRFLKRRWAGIMCWSIFVPAVVWGLFGMMELSCKLRKADIRIDLLVTWPAVIIISALFTAGWLFSTVVALRNGETAKSQQVDPGQTGIHSE